MVIIHGETDIRRFLLVVSVRYSFLPLYSFLLFRNTFYTDGSYKN